MPKNDETAAALQPETQAISSGFDPANTRGAVKPPVYLSSTFAFPTAQDGALAFDIFSGRQAAADPNATSEYIYSRFDNPNGDLAQQRLALLDGAEDALITTSGMAAISTVFFSFLRPGQKIIHFNPIYGGTQVLVQKMLPNFGIIPISFTDGITPKGIAQAHAQAQELPGDIAMIFIEAPANPLNQMIDFELITKEVAAIAARQKIKPLIVCDNTMIGPLYQKPLAHGVDLCVYSLTKYIGGHSDLIAGAITGSKKALQPIRSWRTQLGTQIDPHTAWMLTRSMETFTLRMEKATNTARKVAQWLVKTQPYPLEIFHPEHTTDPSYQAVYQKQCSGPGSTFSFDLKGGRDQAFRLLNALEIIRLAVSLGGSESLACHPASTTHSGIPIEQRQKLGVSEGLIRISIGLEHPDDLIADLKQALAIAHG